MYNTTSKLEVSVDSSIPLLELSTLAAKAKVAALVTNEPSTVSQLLMHRFNLNAKYKIIQTIDFPTGKAFAIDKIKNLSEGAYGADGFDILLSARNEIETNNELSALVKFLKQVNKLFEIRATLGVFTRNEEYVVNMLKAIKTTPVSMIRLDNHLILPDERTKKENVDKIVTLIREHSGNNLKYSPNVSLATMAEYGNTFHRYDVTSENFYNIVKELGGPMEELKALNRIEKKTGKKHKSTSMVIGSVTKLENTEPVKTEVAKVEETKVDETKTEVVAETKVAPKVKMQPNFPTIKITHNATPVTKNKLSVYQFNPKTKNVPIREVDTSKMRVLKGKKV